MFNIFQFFDKINVKHLIYELTPQNIQMGVVFKEIENYYV
jgi:hypothetical protein